MRKLLRNGTALMVVAVVAIGVSTTAMANTTQNSNFTRVCCASRGRGTMYRLMWNEDGTLMSREAFEARVDELIASGSILESDRALFLERFDFCATNGSGTTGSRGACGRNGNGQGRARQGGGRCRS